MLHLLIAILLIYVVFRLARLAFLPAFRRKTTEQKSSTVPAEMVACAACGTFVIGSEAQRHDGRTYCSDTCASART